MNVLDIKDPRFLKKMKIKDLELLSVDIRNFIIDKVSLSGGHLSSNLGITDLTIAIHKVFNSPRDKIIFINAILIRYLLVVLKILINYVN